MFNKLVRNSRSLLILGVLLAVIAFVLAFSVLSKSQNSPASQAAAQPTPVPAKELIAKVDLPALTQVTDLKSTLPYTHQDALLFKWVKDTSGTVDLVVRAADDSRRKPTYYKTTEILPSYLADAGHMRSPFVEPK